MPLTLAEEVDERARRGADQGFYFTIVVLALEGVGTNALFIRLTHKIAIMHLIVEHHMIAFVDLVHHGSEDAKTIHHSRRAGVEARPGVLLTLLAISTLNVYIRERAEGWKVVDVRLGMEPALVRGDKSITLTVMHRSETSVEPLYCVLHRVESERRRKTRMMERRGSSLKDTPYGWLGRISTVSVWGYSPLSNKIITIKLAEAAIHIHCVIVMNKELGVLRIIENPRHCW
jgi:hypothetical protein